ncbi:MAG: TraM recognition domain-containing protein [Planctomycetia bacterium]|nr:TraM recognition domain-containing protein [Planctomycetia bacterium]
MLSPLFASEQSEPMHFGYGLLLAVVTIAWIVGAPILAVLAIAVSAPMPILLDAGAERDASRELNGTVEPVLKDIRSSPDELERTSLFHGQVVEDGSPVLIPRLVHMEHVHGLGDSGGGKTSLFLCPTTEQLVSFGDCSVVVLDLKADSLELLASLQIATDVARRRFGLPMPLKLFSNQRTKTTYAFNPMQQPFWSKFDLLTRTDILCAANGLTYGTDYGAGYFSSANAAILYHTLKTYPHVTTFSELADCIGTVLTVAKKRELHPEIRKAGVHVHEVIKRLAACEALNVTETSGHSPAVVEQAIDLTQLFREPQFLYCHLPSTLSPSGAPEIARLFTYMLLAASTQTERRCPVFLVIDEFQRMVANNLEYMLQLARSMGVGVIIANQSMQDLKRGNIDLIPAIEANCRLRQWFSVSSAEDQERLMRSSGVTIDTLGSESTSINHEGNRSTSYSESEQVVPRLTINDILLTNDHPFRSILRVSRGAGYAQFGGMPVIVESRYHISQQEYQRRKALPWPTAEGAFQPRAESLSEERTTARPPPAQSGVQWSEEVIGGPESSPLSPDGEQDIKSLFDSLRANINAPAPRRRKGDQP